MRFALLGNHPDGVGMALALIESGRHEWVAYSGLPLILQNPAFQKVRTIGDMEEILADPQIEAVIVAGDVASRPVQLRRALQSERHVLCAYPPDETPDITYEAAMIQADTRHVLLPILIGALHPAVRRLKELLGTLPGRLKLIEWERKWCGGGEQEKNGRTFVAHFPGWEILQALGGSIAEVSAFAESEEWRENEPLLISGRFEKGGLFQAHLVPQCPGAPWRLQLAADAIQAELKFPSGIFGPANLTWTDQERIDHREEWPAQDLYREMVQVFEETVLQYERALNDSGTESAGAQLVTWQDAIRAAELDDAARRSVEKRRAMTLEYPEASEEVGFKGTMTLIGCGLLWVMLVLLILARWYPFLLVVIVILLVLFLSLQLLRAIVRK
jgi:predicted dehydrogenase